ncbi:MAG: hypothetical protein AAFN11_23165, partial [Chloroflexota bacterium]
MTSEVQWQNYLSDITDAVFAEDDINAIRDQYGIDFREDRDLVSLIEQLNTNLQSVQPSEKFTRNLKAELLSGERTGVVWRIRRLPARVHFAAIIAASLGGVLLVIQRLMGAGEKHPCRQAPDR